MQRTPRVHSAVFALVLVAGAACGAVGDDVRPIAKVEGWAPSAVAAFDGAQPFAVVEVVFDRESAEKALRDTIPDDLEQRTGEPRNPGLYGSLDAVDFESHAIVLWSSGESGTCPGWLADLAQEDGDGERRNCAARSGRWLQ